MIMRIFFLLYCVQAFTKVRMLKTSCSQHFNEMEKLIYKETDEFHYITHSTIVWNHSCISYITFTDQSVWTYPMTTAIPTYSPTAIPTISPIAIPTISPTAIPTHLLTNSPTEM